MSHRCSPACIVDGKCSKRFPKPFSYSNVVSSESYPVYRRRPPAPDDQEKAANPHLYGETYTYPSRNNTARTIDNRHIVAHNPFLLKKYKSQYVARFHMHLIFYF
jgi:ATP-dependent DNA helicase PIF1